MTRHPYQALPPSAFWRRAISETPPGAIDPVSPPPFQISAEDRVGTAGSCFAQHISRHLRQQGFFYFVTEGPHPMVPDDLARHYSYNSFSARYGNIYTPRQLLQLARRAYGSFTPREDAWQQPDGTLIDPFRPRIQPGGFLSRAEYQADRSQHFAAVRRLLEELDVFVFTLGLTEAWISRDDAAVYPLCPGVVGGSFDDARYEFHNFTVDEVTSDMSDFLDLLHRVNPAAKVILTVSPVPLNATVEARHVLLSSTYSKAVLRVACESLTHSRGDTVYFPSYEIVTGSHTRGAYFADDLRAVTEAGVEHVMKLFFQHFAGRRIETSEPRDVSPTPDRQAGEMARLVEVDCDEAALDP